MKRLSPSCRLEEKKGNDRCSLAGKDLVTFEAIVDSYVKEYRKSENDRLNALRSLHSMNAAIHCSVWDGKNGHQRMVSRHALTLMEDSLLENKANLKEYSCFSALYKVLAGFKIHGIGHLGLYDIALALGSYIGLAPDRVYLHRGTREGAKALAPLGLVKYRAETIAMTDLPAPFRRLLPREAEDCLCIYKDKIKAVVAKMITVHN